MAAMTNVPGPPTPRIKSPFSDDEGNMTTLPDPRSRTMSPANESDPSSPQHHPDLNTEVATLSNKLINAINHQTNLDDTLSATRLELETSQKLVKELERENQEYTDLLSRGALIRRTVADAEKEKLGAILADERRQRAETEKEKKSIEQELENLTTALFEEANKMVITAREEAQKEHDILQRRNDQLRAQLADTDSLLKSHQDQLAELKQVMEQLTEEREEQQTSATAPSTPGLSKFDSKDDMRSQAEDTTQSSLPEVLSPSYPTSFTHLLHPVLRTDLSAFDDFTSLLRMSKNVVGSRVSSGSYGSSIGLGLGLGGYRESIAHQPHNGSTSSLSTAATGSSPATPTTPASTVSNGSTNGPNSLTPLKETKFYKRALAEDIEPTLRLDTAPGLSWLARRTVLNAVCEGTLVVEPMPPSTKPYIFACSLCGETRKDPAHIRSHRFKASESESAQRYPLCKYCHGRVRSTCDLLGFLRILKEGHWRTDEDSEKAAWEESVRLREQMFWCRMGGGVVPAHHSHPDPARSPRVSSESRIEQEKELKDEVERTGEIHPRDVTPVIEQARFSSSSTAKRSSKPVRSDATEKPSQATQDSAKTSSPIADRAKIEPEIVDQKVKDVGNNVQANHSEMVRDSLRSIASLEVGDNDREPSPRLSITIPSSLGDEVQ